ncbi:MAG: hypothetical protein ACOXZI_00855 [Candidatus Cryptobacteroides sp.]|jgi:hypothetical protein
MFDIKKIIIVCGGLLAALSAFAQHPTSTWPYIYDDFTSGKLTALNGTKSESEYNVSLVDGSLHFIEDGFVKKISAGEVLYVKIGADEFINVGGMLHKVLAKSDKSVVVQEYIIDYATLNSTGGAYGAPSTTLGTTQLTSLEGVGGTNSSSSLNHIELMRGKNSGEALPLIHKTYIVVKGNKIFTAKKDVLEFAGDSKKEAAAFIKENKIKWKDHKSLLLVGDYLCSTF